VRARSEAQGGRIPAVALTAYARPEDQDRALNAGFQIHLSKPIDDGDLVGAVATLVGRATT
jgi:CheY-like chemotaxis protein